MFSKKLYFIVMAGGVGRRMGSTEPKQFLLLDGKPIICHTIGRIVSVFPDCRIITVLPKDYIAYWKEYCQTHNFNVPQVLVEGGITRFHSVKNALSKVPEGAIVAIHDAVRPFFREDNVREMVKRMEEGERGLIPVVPVVDSLINLEGDAVDRSKIRAVQTPQMFLSEEIKKAYETAYDTSFTDDGNVARKNGIPVSYCDGDRYNIKITTPEDLRMGEFICGIFSSLLKK